MRITAIGFLTSVLLASSAPAFAELRPITHEDVWLMKRAGTPVVSPDGKWAVLPVTDPDYDQAKESADLWLVATDGGTAPRRLTTGKAQKSGAAWSPDGKSIAFSTKREGDEAAQIYILPMDGGEARRVTTLAGGAHDPKWRPDGKTILFEADIDPNPEERKQKKSNARIYDAMPVRFWNHWLDDKRPHIFVLDLSDGAEAFDILKGTQLEKSSGFRGNFNPLGTGQSLQAQWAPDGQSIVFSAVVNGDKMMTDEVVARLFQSPAKGGEPVALTPEGPSYSRPLFSATGDALFAEQRRRAAPGGRLYSLTRLARIAWPGGKPEIITGDWDRSVDGFAIAPDGSTIFISSQDDGFNQLFKMPAKGGAVERLFKVTRGGYSGVQPAAGGVVALYQTALQPSELVRIDTGAATHRALTHFNDERAAAIDAPEPIHFWFTAHDGRRIHTVMFLPPHFDAKRKYPLLVFPHGGPNSMSSDDFSVRWNAYLLASPGYVVIETNYVGSTGFGEKFADDIERDVLKGPANEILEAAHEAARQYPYVDERREAAAGASYGGYLVNWFNGHTDQFKCIVSHAGAMNNESQYGDNDGGIDRELRMGGPVWEHRGQWIEQSPHNYAAHFHTPTLITQGEIDFRVPVSESLTTFKLLQRRGVASRLVVFPDEGHWILKGEDARLHMKEVLAWLGKYLSTTSASAGP